MDSPHGAPETSSPVVLLRPPSHTQFFSSIARNDVSTNQPRARGMTAMASSTSAVRTSNSFAFNPPVGGDQDVATGPTTRSRKRSHNSALEISTEATSVLPAATAPSRKRKAPSASTKGSRIKTSRASNRKKPPPGACLKQPTLPSTKCKSDGNDNDGDKKPAAVVENCCICMCDVEPNDLAEIDKCNHRFCFGCIEKWSERENKCPLCKTRFTKIDRVHKKRKKGMKNTKKVKQRNQRSDPPGGLEGLIANLNRSSGNLARFILGGLEFPPGGSSFPTTIRGASGAQADFVDEDSDDDDDSPIAAFMRALHGSTVVNGVSMSTTVMRPMTVHVTTTTRSFARNTHDSTAGNGADNPLEIDDDSVEEVIEID